MSTMKTISTLLPAACRYRMSALCHGPLESVGSIYSKQACMHRNCDCSLREEPHKISTLYVMSELVVIYMIAFIMRDELLHRIPFKPILIMYTPMCHFNNRLSHTIFVWLMFLSYYAMVLRSNKVNFIWLIYNIVCSVMCFVVNMFVDVFVVFRILMFFFFSPFIFSHNYTGRNNGPILIAQWLKQRVPIDARAFQLRNLRIQVV